MKPINFDVINIPMACVDTEQQRLGSVVCAILFAPTSKAIYSRVLTSRYEVLLDRKIKMFG